MSKPYMVGKYEYCRKCNCPLFDHNEDPVNNCPKKRVYKWEQYKIVASSVTHAHLLLCDEFGERFGSSRYKVTRDKGPFVVCDPFDMVGHKVSEDIFAATVETYAGGFVKEL